MKKSIDHVFKNLCAQITRKPSLQDRSFEEIIEFRTRLNALDAEIVKLKSGIAKSKQFNRTVELNLALKKKEQEILNLLDS